MFNQRKNKRFSYTPRHKESKSDTKSEDLKAKWNELKPASKRKGTVFANLPLLLILLAALFILIFVLRGYE